MTHCLTRLSSPPENATNGVEPNVTQSTAAGWANLQLINLESRTSGIGIEQYVPCRRLRRRHEVVKVHVLAAVSLVSIVYQRRHICLTPSHDPTSNRLESGDHATDEMPSDGACNERSAAFSDFLRRKYSSHELPLSTDLLTCCSFVLDDGVWVDSDVIRTKGLSLVLDVEVLPLLCRVG